MNRIIPILVVGLVILGGSTSIQAQEYSFSLNDRSGKDVHVDAKSGRAIVVAFLGTECPLARLYSSRLNRLSEEFEQVRFVGVFSNQQDSQDEINKFEANYRIRFPLVRDNGNVVADRFDAKRTPEVFLLSPKLELLYRGRVDDQYQPGVARSEPQQEELKAALQQWLEGKLIEVTETQPEGCLIGRIRKPGDKNSVTFTNQIARLLNSHCLECHRQGEIGPMAFSDYDEVVGWAETIVEVVQENRMPPWHASPKHGEFINARTMTAAEKQMLVDWVTAGCPKGDTDDLPVMTPSERKSEWRLPREPDLVVPMRKRPFNVPAEGTVEYQYFVVDPGLKEDKWVTAAEVIPGDRSVLHHSIVFVRPPDGTRMRGIGWLAAYVPGQSAPIFNPKFGRRIPAGSKLVFQQHYTPNGKVANDITRVGMVFGNEKEIEHEVMTLLALDEQFVIPPHANHHQVDVAFRWWPEQGSLIGISPHMHYRGKSFQMRAQIEDKSQILLDVPNYDFNWQHIYQFQNPMKLDNVQQLEFTATFDNSSNNPFNPDPSQQVTWGDQTWEEMAVGFLIVSNPRASKEKAPEPTAEAKAELEAKAERVKIKANQFADKFFKMHDKNGDGKVTMNEMPKSVERFGRWYLDPDGDNIVTRKEILDSITWYYNRSENLVDSP